MECQKVIKAFLFSSKISTEMYFFILVMFLVYFVIFHGKKQRISKEAMELLL
jgi:Ca2+/Na+ antiporter